MAHVNQMDTYMEDQWELIIPFWIHRENIIQRHISLCEVFKLWQELGYAEWYAENHN